MKIIQFVNFVEETLCCLLLAFMLVVVFIATISRYVFNYPIGWTDEIAKICFTWIVFLAASVGVRKKSHISINFIVRVMPIKFQFMSLVIANALIFLILLSIIYYGYRLCLMTMPVTTPMLGISNAVVYSSAPISACLMLFHHARNVIDDIKYYRQG